MKRIWFLFSQAITVLLAIYFVVLTLKPEWLKNKDTASIYSPNSHPSSLLSTGESPPGSFRHAAKLASLAVVSINTSRTTQSRTTTQPPWFDFFFDKALTQPRVGLGSGVIVSSKGYILTNNHVIDGADEINVTLNDNRIAKATIVGTDPDTDLAVLKINLSNLPVITWGDASDVFVGDRVLAIGNPFGVGQTVTSGIVSAIGRNHLGVNTYEDFIQTDAAINPGNSGGALVDTQGKLVGINSVIYSRSGGSLGIGFAIPISTAKMVLEGLINRGRVLRGWIGIEPTELTKELASTLDLEKSLGVIINGVLQNAPAHLAGMRPGDLVIEVAGVPVYTVPALLKAISLLEPGKTTHFSVLRQNQRLSIAVTPDQRPISQIKHGD